ncbi:hypothetical protein TIFTF001_055704 [Ficus carica]|uniref:Uncharacterized protein n=1 Tax=Ficus carica TaxID=3494 RepID=A0AA88EEN3_FICCA|nr:hypothetical protein TIFTF001_055704 [Ficus carica]
MVIEASRATEAPIKAAPSIHSPIAGDLFASLGSGLMLLDDQECLLARNHCRPTDLHCSLRSGSSGAVVIATAGTGSCEGYMPWL